MARQEVVLVIPRQDLHKMTPNICLTFWRFHEKHANRWSQATTTTTTARVQLLRSYVIGRLQTFKTRHGKFVTVILALILVFLASLWIKLLLQQTTINCKSIVLLRPTVPLSRCCLSAQFVCLFAAAPASYTASASASGSDNTMQRILWS